MIELSFENIKKIQAKQIDVDNLESALQLDTKYVEHTNFQTELDNKAPLVSPTFTGTVTVPAVGAETNKTAATVGYVDKSINDLVNGAEGTMDTLKELGDAILENRDIITAIETINTSYNINGTFSASNGSAYISLNGSDGSEDMIRISGSGRTTVTTDAAGNFNIDTPESPNTTYELTKTDNVITLSGSDGNNSTVIANDTTYTLDKIGNTISLSGSDGSTSSVNIDEKLITLQVINLKDGWKFNKISNVANTAYSSTAETAISFDDSTWRDITVPHDWSIENDFNQSSPAGYEGGYLDGGDAWYRKAIYLDEDQADKEIILNFDGIYKNSDVYINGTHVHGNVFGYNPFNVNISDYVVAGKNIIAVFVRNQQPSSRWYSGSGIYRNVKMILRPKSTIKIDHVKVTTPELSSEMYKQFVTTVFNLSITNENEESKDTQVMITINDKDSTVVSERSLLTVNSGTSNYTVTVNMPQPKLWDVLNGNTYIANIKIFYNNEQYEYLPIKYGYRTIEFDSDDGLILNGKQVFMKGVCMHHDLGILGAAVNRSAIERQVDLLIDMGCNAIRLSHNPPSIEMLDVCTDKGILLVEELFDCWTYPKKTYDFGNDFTNHKDEVIDSVMRRDVNYPSIIMWSIGNEIIRTSQYTAEQAMEVAQSIIDRIRMWDTYIPITMGADNPSDSVEQAVMSLMDVIGINYGSDTEYNIIRNLYSDRAVYGSETTSAISSRNIYFHDNTGKQCSSLDDDKVSWGDYASTALIRHMETFDWLAGMFVWTGFDYIGEPTPFNSWTSKSSYFGIIDLAGFPKDSYYLYQSEWSNKPMCHLFGGQWVSSTITNKTLYGYSNCHSVKLFVNDRLVASKTKDQRDEKLRYVFTVVYEEGTVAMCGYDEHGVYQTSSVLVTPTDSTTIQVSSNSDYVDVNSDDLVYVVAEEVYNNGSKCITSEREITFSCNGGEIIGTDAGNAASVESMHSATKKLFGGKALAMIKHNKAGGNMVVTAHATTNNLGGSLVIGKDSETIPTKFMSLLKQYMTKPVGYVPPFIVEDTPYIPPVVTFPATIYELEQPKVFVSANQDYIDTGVQLLNEDKAWSVYLEFDSSAINTNNADSHCILHCMNETNPWPGLSLAKWTGNFGINYYDKTTAVVNNGYFTNNGIWKFLFVKPVANESTVTIYSAGVNTTIMSGSCTPTPSKYVYIDETLVAGCYRAANGTLGRFWNGTIYNLKIWNVGLNADQRNALFENA